MNALKFVERALRIDVHRSALMIDSQGDEHPVTLLNISSRGFALETERPIFAGEDVRLRVDRHDELSGQICWTRGYEAGGTLTQAVKLN